MRALICAILCVATPVLAQERQQTLADIRQELTVLHVEMQKLRRELSTTGGVNSNLSGTNALERLDAMEAEVRRLTAANETLTNRVDSVVRDGTNRIGDLEFRLCELETACDIGQLGETTTLGGGALPAATTSSSIEPAAPAPGGEIGTADVAAGIIDTDRHSDSYSPRPTSVSSDVSAGSRSGSSWWSPSARPSSFPSTSWSHSPAATGGPTAVSWAACSARSASACCEATARSAR